MSLMSREVNKLISILMTDFPSLIWRCGSLWCTDGSKSLRPCRPGDNQKVWGDKEGFSHPLITTRLKDSQIQTLLNKPPESPVSSGPVRRGGFWTTSQGRTRDKHLNWAQNCFKEAAAQTGHHIKWPVTGFCSNISVFWMKWLCFDTCAVFHHLLQCAHHLRPSSMQVGLKTPNTELPPRLSWSQLVRNWIKAYQQFRPGAFIKRLRLLNNRQIF